MSYYTFIYLTFALCYCFFFFFSSRRRHTRLQGDWSSDVCSSDLRARRPPRRRWSRGRGQDSQSARQQRHLHRQIAQGVTVGVDRERSVGGDLDLPRPAHLHFVELDLRPLERSEERRVGKECRSRW